MPFINEQAKADYNKIQELRNKQSKLENEIDDITKLGFGFKISTDPSLMWECEKSPFGTCAYEPMVDPSWDNCTYCGHPYDRG